MKRAVAVSALIVLAASCESAGFREGKRMASRAALVAKATERCGDDSKCRDVFYAGVNYGIQVALCLHNDCPEAQ